MKWTRDHYARAITAGVFGEDDPIELIGGEIVEHMGPQKTKHASGIRGSVIAMQTCFPEGYDIRAQLPFAIGEHSEPEPDVLVVKGHWRDFVDEHPVSAVLIIEISDTSFSYDVSTKASLYAAADVPDYWVLNLPKRQLVVMREPAAMSDQLFGYGYKSTTVLGPADSVEPLATPGQKIKIADLLP
jgi:Uma2 family endonuclease